MVEDMRDDLLFLCSDPFLRRGVSPRTAEAIERVALECDFSDDIPVAVFGRKAPHE